MTRSCNSYATKGQSSALKRTLRRFCNGLRGCKRSYSNELAHIQFNELWAEKWECQIEEPIQKKRKFKNPCLETIPEEQEYYDDMKKAMVYYPIEIEDHNADCVVFDNKSSPIRNMKKRLVSKPHVLF
ncbi:hypothetical protein EPUL_001651 [Erysiphe pulchra]|uniref:Uncharacterized protein n=1 Tax=Erysiphe pulchra TaxID=225359 RepID=A0A2S4Q0H8_9PEZI|nr:hypothetical protein EPUL_001651 [Erysiphe pulchra]